MWDYNRPKKVAFRGISCKLVRNHTKIVEFKIRYSERLTCFNKVIRSPPTQYSSTNHKCAEVSYLKQNFPQNFKFRPKTASNFTHLPIKISFKLTKNKISAHLDDLKSEASEPASKNWGKIINLKRAQIIDNKWLEIGAHFLKDFGPLRLIDALDRKILDRLLHPTFVHSLRQAKKVKSSSKIDDWVNPRNENDAYWVFAAADGLVDVVVVHGRGLGFQRLGVERERERLREIILLSKIGGEREREFEWDEIENLRVFCLHDTKVYTRYLEISP